MGNAVVLDPYHSTELEQEGTQNLTSLKEKVDLSSYLTDTSDLVALMTFEHQLRMSNLIARTNLLAREAEQSSNAETMERLNAGIDEMLQYMLFADEAALQEPIRGVSTFTTTFPSKGPHDHAGRSLRDFDLQTRIFRYPLSYMIYSAAFDAIPDTTKVRIYNRLYDILTTQDPSVTVSGVSSVNREAILEIVRSTKPDLPTRWQQGP